MAWEGTIIIERHILDIESDRAENMCVEDRNISSVGCERCLEQFLLF